MSCMPQRDPKLLLPHILKFCINVGMSISMFQWNLNLQLVWTIQC